MLEFGSCLSELPQLSFSFSRRRQWVRSTFDTMPSLFPTLGALESVFSHNPSSRKQVVPAPKSLESKSKPFEWTAYSVIDDAKPAPIQPYSAEYYATCTFGGMLACGVTHTAVTPLDLVKCRRQVDSKLYKGNFQAWRIIGKAEGMRGIFTGWSPTFFGYSAQGAAKYGFYEFFKKFYSDLAGPENAYKYKTGIYLAGSASAEFIADLFLCPFEAVKVRMQTTIPAFTTGTFSGISAITAKEGYAGLYKGLYPLWGRQIPYTMMKVSQSRVSRCRRPF